MVQDSCQRGVGECEAFWGPGSVLGWEENEVPPRDSIERGSQNRGAFLRGPTIIGIIVFGGAILRFPPLFRENTRHVLRSSHIETATEI